MQVPTNGRVSPGGRCRRYGRLYRLKIAIQNGQDDALVSLNSTGKNTGSFNPPTFDTGSGLPRQKSYLNHTDNRGDDWLVEHLQHVLQLLIGARGSLRKYVLLSKDDTGFRCEDTCFSRKMTWVSTVWRTQLSTQRTFHLKLVY